MTSVLREANVKMGKLYQTLNKVFNIKKPRYVIGVKQRGQNVLRFSVVVFVFIFLKCFFFEKNRK
jgi:hypothetical protein